MGLDAEVRCRCWEEKSYRTPPPFADEVGIDSDGYVGFLRDPTEADRWDKYDALNRWLVNCCPHEGMVLLRSNINNWSGYYQFREIVFRLDAVETSTLRAELPTANGGMTSAQSSAHALTELAYFRDQAPWLTNAYLIDEETDTQLAGYFGRLAGEIVGGSYDHVIGVDPEGFFVRLPNSDPLSNVPGRLIFQSRRFVQRVLNPYQGDSSEVDFTDLSTGHTIRCGKAVPRSTALGGVERIMRVACVLQDPTDYSRTLENLEKVFKASVVTGNPVCWC